jgi:hypothetical protein
VQSGSDDGPPPETAHHGTINLLDEAWARAQQFDLNRFNWGGWVLLLATFGFVMAEAAVLVWVVGVRWQDRAQPMVFALMLVLAVGFFFALRWLLFRLGVSIYRG